MRRLFELVLAACLLLSLGACGDTAASPVQAHPGEAVLHTSSDVTSAAASEHPRPPILKADGILQTEIGGTVDYLSGITAEDARGNSLTGGVSWQTDANLTKVGDYTVTYTVTDSNGAAATLTRILKVLKPPSRYDAEKTRALVSASLEKHHAMGISAAVTENGEVVGAVACGDAVYGEKEMTIETKLRIASISKIGIAMAAAKLYDEGRIDIDADISTYWGASFRNPSYPDVPLTIRDILCHTSSLTSNDEDYMLSTDSTLAQLKNGSVFSACKPGAVSSYMYNNYAFGVLADTLELILGENLDTYIQENIFDKMGITASYLTQTMDPDTLAALYNADWECERSVPHMASRPFYSTLGAYIWYYPGNLTISAADLARVMTVLINGGMYGDTRILSPHAAALLEEPQFSIDYEDPTPFTQCMPLRYRSGMYGRQNLYYHTGSAFGVFALVCYDPDTGDGVTVITSGASTGYDKYGVTTVCADIAGPVLDMLKR